MDIEVFEVVKRDFTVVSRKSFRREGFHFRIIRTRENVDVKMEKIMKKGEIMQNGGWETKNNE